MPCARTQITPNYDNQFWNEVTRCPKSPASAYCACYESAAQKSLNRNAASIPQIYNPQDSTSYPAQTDVTADYPYRILGSVSRADQKKNIFTKAFDPKNRKIIILLIAGFLLFLAVTNAE